MSLELEDGPITRRWAYNWGGGLTMLRFTVWLHSAKLSSNLMHSNYLAPIFTQTSGHSSTTWKLIHKSINSNCTKDLMVCRPRSEHFLLSPAPAAAFELSSLTHCSPAHSFPGDTDQSWKKTVSVKSKQINVHFLFTTHNAYGTTDNRYMKFSQENVYVDLWVRK